MSIVSSCHLLYRLGRLTQQHHAVPLAPLNTTVRCACKRREQGSETIWRRFETSGDFSNVDLGNLYKKTRTSRTRAWEYNRHRLEFPFPQTSCWRPSETFEIYGNITLRTLMRWLQLRFDFNSTAARLGFDCSSSKVIKITVT